MFIEIKEEVPFSEDFKVNKNIVAEKEKYSRGVRLHEKLDIKEYQLKAQIFIKEEVYIEKF